MIRALDKIVPVLVILAGLVVVWYVAAVLLNAPLAARPRPPRRRDA